MNTLLLGLVLYGVTHSLVASQLSFFRVAEVTVLTHTYLMICKILIQNALKNREIHEEQTLQIWD